jgi:hypothetical protein
MVNGKVGKIGDLVLWKPDVEKELQQNLLVLKMNKKA